MDIKGFGVVLTWALDAMLKGEVHKKIAKRFKARWGGGGEKFYRLEGERAQQFWTCDLPTL